jgi:hypothetical protein
VDKLFRLVFHVKQLFHKRSAANCDEKNRTFPPTSLFHVKHRLQHKIIIMQRAYREIKGIEGSSSSLENVPRET